MIQKLCIFSILCVISLTSACGTKPQTKINAYQQDGFLGMSNANPNLPTSPSYHNYRKDMNLMNESITGIKAVRGSSIFISGPHAYIRLKMDHGFSMDESRRIVKEATDSLSYMVPRYVFHVTIVPIPPNG